MQGPGALILNIPIQLQSVAQPSSITTATNIPPALAVLPAGIILKGNVAGRDPNGNTILRTEKGDLVLQTGFFLKRDTEITLRLDKVKDDLFAKLITIDGKSVAKYIETQQGAPAEDDVIIEQRPLSSSFGTLASATAQEEAPLAPFPQLRAILLSPPPQLTGKVENLPPQTAILLQQAKPGTAIFIEIRQVIFPTIESPLAATETASPLTAAPVPPNSAAPAAGNNTAPPQPPLPTGTQTPATTTQAALSPLQAAPQPATPLPPTQEAILPPLPPTSANLTPPAAATVETGVMPAVPTTVSTSTIATPAPALPGAPAPLVNASPTATAPVATSPLPQTTGTVTLTAPSATPSPAAPAQTVPPSTTTLAVPAQLPATPQLPPSAIQTANPPAAPAVPNPAVAAYGAAPFTQPSAANTPQMMEGIVVAQEESGSLTLQTPLGLTRIMVPQPLPTGTKLLFTITAVVPDTDGDSDGLATSPPSGRMDGMQPLASLTYPQMNALAPTPLHLLPRSGNDFGTELFLLLGAIKGGDMRKWLENQPKHVLDKIGEENVLRLQNEFSGLRQTVTDSRDQTQWNLYHLPVLTGNEVEQMKLYFRDPRGDESPGQEKGGTRKKSEESEHFVFDVTFSRLGRIQFDGLVQRPDKKGLQFDLAVRSEKSLTPEMRQHIRGIYQTTQQISGFAGILAFHSGREACLTLDTPTPNSGFNASSILA